MGALEKLMEHYERAFNNARRRDLDRLSAQFSLEVRPIFEGIQKQFPEDGMILHSLIGTEIGRYITISTVYSCISYLRAITNNANPRYLNTLLENAEILKEEKLYSCSSVLHMVDYPSSVEGDHGYESVRTPEERGPSGLLVAHCRSWATSFKLFPHSRELQVSGTSIGELRNTGLGTWVLSPSRKSPLW